MRRSRRGGAGGARTRAALLAAASGTITLVAAGRAERRPDAVRFAEKLRLHAEVEEQVLYPAAVLVGREIEARLAA